MKKMLGILSTFVLEGSTIIGLTSTINTNQIKINVSWTFLAALSLIPVISSILSWINLYK